MDEPTTLSELFRDIEMNALLIDAAPRGAFVVSYGKADLLTLVWWPQTVLLDPPLQLRVW